MISLENETTFDEFLLNLESSLNTTIDTDSFDAKFLKVFYDYATDLNTKISTKINERFYENLSGDNLEQFLSFFNVERKNGGLTDIYTFTIYLSSNTSVKMLAESKIEFNGEEYLVIKDEYLSQGLNKVSTYNKSTSSSIVNTCFTKDGLIKFDRSSIEIEGVENIEAFVSKNMKLVSVAQNYSEVESDYELLERSKSLMQTQGYANNKKIQLELLSDSRIKDVAFEEVGGVTEVTIIPHELDSIDEVIEYATEVVEYYKDTGIEINKPSVLEFYIEGIEKQIIFEDEYETILDTITEYIQYFLNSTVETTIYKSSFITSIQNAIYSVSPDLAIDYSSIKLLYNYYSKNNYTLPVLTEEVTNSKTVSSGSVITLGRVG